ncbi:hypothetical protein [Novosphingobium malaysiense]|uniref:Twin-arginine translocation pathway signal protein n=1 Tax=Novosphingobium malaysiense TaxID=1348853 RepID=A0A0B1ZIT4_9SPHN|nr:hypothetical protein [Novosphingobium malaysiense]KHK91015.1 twin-arginine translocation pathway signal protein [Novosphingobium malaysiense]
MKLRITGAGLALTMLTTANGPALAGASQQPGNLSEAAASAPQDTPALEAKAQFVPADFDVPTSVEANGFKLVPLGPALVKIDFDAYMSSIEHLQKTFSRSTAWPHPDISDADAMLDMETEQGRFEQRTSFAYAVLTPDGLRERGCVYVYPSPVKGYDAMVRMWVTEAEYDAGFETELYNWVTQWIQKDWPFDTVAYPGHSVDWATWDDLVAAKKAGELPPEA